MEELVVFLESKEAWNKNHIQYKYWANIIRYVYGDATPYNIKKIFNKALSNDLFFVQKRSHRLYYKYKSIREPYKDRYTLHFD